MKAFVAALVLAACTHPPQKQKPIVTPIVRREVKPMAPKPGPVDPIPLQPQGKLADPPTEQPTLPPLNPGTHGDQPATEPPK